MSAGLVFVGVLALGNLLLILLVARQVRLLRERPIGPARQPWLAAGTKIPPFEAETVSGERISLGRLRGQRSLVGLFSTSCEPCRQQLPVFAREGSVNGGREHILAVVVGPAAEAAEYLSLLNGSSLVVWERDSLQPVAAAFSARAFPGIYVLDAEGRVVASGPSVAAIIGALRDVAAAAQ